MGNETGSAAQPSTLCSRCGGSTIPIAYGMPDADFFDAAERGEVELAGCIMPEDPPTRRCRTCGAGWPEPTTTISERRLR